MFTFYVLRLLECYRSLSGGFGGHLVLGVVLVGMVEVFGGGGFFIFLLGFL